MAHFQHKTTSISTQGTCASHSFVEGIVQLFFFFHEKHEDPNHAEIELS